MFTMFCSKGNQSQFFIMGSYLKMKALKKNKNESSEKDCSYFLMLWDYRCGHCDETELASRLI